LTWTSASAVPGVVDEDPGRLRAEQRGHGRATLPGLEIGREHRDVDSMPGSDLAGELFEAIDAPRDDGHVVPASGEPAGEFSAEPRRRAGHECRDRRRHSFAH
jgi:hypothetical protein